MIKSNDLNLQTDVAVPDDHELLRRMMQKYRPVLKDGEIIAV